MEASASQSAEVTCRIVTGPDLAGPTPALVVQSLKWDSGFRAAGLLPGDRIVAVDGAPLQLPADPHARPRAVSLMVGQLSESQAWAAAGRADGDAVALTVVRRRPPAGSETLELTGTLRAERYWRSAEGRPLMAAEGPDGMASDGFSSTWSSWYERASSTWERAWALRAAGSLVQRIDVDVDDAAAHVAKLTELYPGPFAAAVAADWAALSTVVDGRDVALGPGALDYRSLGEQRVGAIRDAGVAARAAFLAAHAAELVPPFPSIDPILGDRASVAGKLVELPRVTQREWVSQGDRTVFLFAQGSDCYVAEVDGPTEQMIVTQRRYERLVTPSVRSEYEVLARVLPEPTMAMSGERAFFALKVLPVAASVGGAFFVELPDGVAPAPFEGEASLTDATVDPPGPAASPGEVFAAMIGALQAGDLELWRSTYSDWTFTIADDGRPLLSPWGPANLDGNWEQARRRILDDVVDVRVAWVDDVVTVFDADAFEGAPTIEQALLEVEHVRLVGDAPDAGATTFVGVGLTRLWTLQRLNGGPWRIATNAGI